MKSQVEDALWWVDAAIRDTQRQIHTIVEALQTHRMSLESIEKELDRAKENLK